MKISSLLAKSPLVDRTILVTRPHGREKHLLSLIKRAGGTPIHYPAISIEPPRELEIKGFVGYGRERWRGETKHTFEITHALMQETGAPLEDLVTHVSPLEQYQDALRAAANHRRSGAVKVVLKP